MRFDLTDLRLFLHIVEAASITHGAERAGLALASASGRIRGMEEALGVDLLERGRRGVRPTPAGQALLHHARIVNRQVERMRGELGTYATGLRGQVRLFANTAALTEFLPDLLGPFLTADPAVDVDLQERPSYQIVRALAEGSADIGLVSDAVETVGLETFPFRNDAMVLVTPRDHPLAGQRSVTLAEVVGHEFVGLAPGSAFQIHLDHHVARAGHRLKLRVQLGGFDAVCRLVGQGVGLGIVSEAAAHRCRRSTGVRIVPLAEPWAKRSLLIAVRRFDALSRHAQRLVGHLRSGTPSPPGESHLRKTVARRAEMDSVGRL